MDARGWILIVIPMVVVGHPAVGQDPRLAGPLERWEKGELGERLLALRRIGRLGDRATPAVATIAAGATDPDPRIRAATLRALGAIGGPRDRVGPILIAALRDPDASVRLAAAREIDRDNVDVAAAIPALAASLTSADRRCLSAAHSLKRLGSPAARPLVEALSSAHPDLRRTAASALGEMEEVPATHVPRLIGSLRDPDRETRARVALCLGRIGPAAVDPLIEGLRDPSPTVRGASAFALSLMEPGPARAVPALLDAMSSPVQPDSPEEPRDTLGFDWNREDEPTPTAYEKALRRIGADAHPVLLERLVSRDRAVRLIAIRAIGALKEQAGPLIDRLIGLLADRDLRLDASDALGTIGPPAYRAVTPLIKLLNDTDPLMRARTAETIGRIGWARRAAQYSTVTVAARAVPPLTRRLTDPDPRVRAAIVRALADIGTRSEQPGSMIGPLLRDPSTDVRRATLRASSRLGPIRDEDLNIVLKLAADPDPGVRIAAIKVIRRDDTRSKAVIDALLARLRDPDVETRASAAVTLAINTTSRNDLIFGSRFETGAGRSEALVADRAASALARTALQDPDPRVRAAATHILSCFPDDLASVPLLIARLKDDEINVRACAADALGAFGARAAAAIPALMQGLADPNRVGFSGSSVAASSAQALISIRPSMIRNVLDRLTSLLEAPDPAARYVAASALEGLDDPENPAVLICMVELLTDPATSRVMRREALSILNHIVVGYAFDLREIPRQNDPVVRRALPSLRSLLLDPDVSVRILARKQLLAQESDETQAVKIYLDETRDELPVDRALAIQKSTWDPRAADALIDALGDPDEQVRSLAAYALASIPEGSQTPDAVQLTPALRARIVANLIRGLKDPEPEVRWAASWGLLAYGPGEGVLAALMEMAKDRTTRVRPGVTIRVATAPNGGNGNSVTFHGGDVLIRVGAIQAMGSFEDAASPALPLLREMLREPDLPTRRAALLVLTAMGARAVEALPELTRMLSSQQISVRQSPFVWRFEYDDLRILAANAIEAIGRDAIPAAPALIAAYARADDSLEIVLTQALSSLFHDDVNRNALRPIFDGFRSPNERIRSGARRVLAELVDEDGIRLLLGDTLDDPDPLLRLGAAQTLESLGEAALPALENLRRHRDDPDADVRRAVRSAIEGLESSKE